MGWDGMGWDWDGLRRQCSRTDGWLTPMTRLLSCLPPKPEGLSHPSSSHLACPHPLPSARSSHQTTTNALHAHSRMRSVAKVRRTSRLRLRHCRSVRTSAALTAARFGYSSNTTQRSSDCDRLLTIAKALQFIAIRCTLTAVSAQPYCELRTALCCSQGTACRAACELERHALAQQRIGLLRWLGRAIASQP